MKRSIKAMRDPDRRKQSGQKRAPAGSKLFCSKFVEWAPPPGRRPDALWDYDLGGWERYGESEEDAVRSLVKQGLLEPVHRNGLVVIADEVAEIEASWLREIGIALGGRREVLPITEPLSMWAVRRGSIANTRPPVLAEVERARWYGSYRAGAAASRRSRRASGAAK